MERLDKIISSLTEYSRKEVRNLVRQKRVSVNSITVEKADLKINPIKDKIMLDNKALTFQEHVYLILNKPKDYISATTDPTQATVLDLVPSKYLHRDLFPAGRLDKDTTGLMIITDDGQFAHDILSPKKHVPKTYKVTVDIPLTKEMIEAFKAGIILNDGKCKSASLEIKNTFEAILTITEGRYHQIKRMFAACKATVIELERLGMGNLFLPTDLARGTCRELTKEELAKVTNSSRDKSN